MTQRKRQASGGARRSSNGHSRRRAFESTHRPTEFEIAIERGFEKIKRGCGDLFTDFPGVTRKMFKKMHKALNAPPPKPSRSWTNSRMH